MMNKKICIFIITALSIVKANAQNNASPYSIIGIGDIEKSFFDRTSGMGHAGVALSSNGFFYHANPASYSFLDDSYFHIEGSLRYKNISYSGDPIKNSSENQSADLASKKIAFAIKLKHRWGLSFGLLPFSTSNYSFTAPKSIIGTPFTITPYYKGSGSVNKFYVANSYQIISDRKKTGEKNKRSLSVGLEASYLFGQQQQEETMQNSIADSTLYTKRNITLGKMYFVAGIQYKEKINKKWELAIGGSFANKTKLNSTYRLFIQDGSQILVNDEELKKDYFRLPYIFTVGVAATLKDKLTFALDYNYQDWSGSKYKGSNYSLVNSDRISAGFQYSNKMNVSSGTEVAVLEKSFVQLGVFHSNTYLKMNGQQLKDYGLTIGGGLNFFKGLTGFGVVAGLEVGQRGTTNKGLVKENYTQFNLTLSYREFWFTKRRKYD